MIQIYWNIQGLLQWDIWVLVATYCPDCSSLCCYTGIETSEFVVIIGLGTKILGFLYWIVILFLFSYLLDSVDYC